jgi:DNA-binding NtrC family response regulator
VAVDIQVVAATSEDLERLVRERRFREDLFWRLREITVQMPSLSDRPLDIPVLAETLLRQSSTRYGRPPMRLDDGALRLLVSQDWSRAGNIRGLEHTLNRSVLLAPPGATVLAEGDVELDGALTAGAARRGAPPSPGAESAGPSRPLRRRDLDDAALGALRALLHRKLVEHGGTLAAAAADPEVAAALGYGDATVPGSTLALWLQDLKLDEVLAEERRKRQSDLGIEEIKAAIRAHGNGAAAAKALGITRDTLVHRLRKAGLSIGDLSSS